MLIKAFGYLKDYKKYYYLGVLCTALETAFQLILTLLMANIVDIGIVNRDMDYILKQGVLMIGMALISLFLGRAAARFTAITGIGLGAELRKIQFEEIQKLSFSQIDDFKTGSLITRLTTDITRIQTAFMMATRMLIRAPLMIIIAVVLAMFISVPLTTVFIVSIPVLAIGITLLIIKVRPLFTNMQERMDDLNVNIQENLAGIRVVKFFNREEEEIEEFSLKNLSLKNISLKALRYMVMAMPLVQVLTFGTIIAILWIGGNMVYSGDLTIGKLTIFISYVNQIMFFMMMLSFVVVSISRSMASLKRVFEVIETEKGIDITAANSENIVKYGKIEFKDVFFKYHKSSDDYVLKNINLVIEPGMKVGILGGTGSGKSTLVQLIPRLYELDKGVILVDDVDIKKYFPDELRKGVSMVLQQNTLFSGTISENLRIGNENATESELIKACEIAVALEFINKLADGFDHILEQEASNLSGGQKQRLCIARAILTHPKILIMDDSTSAVDTSTEQNIREGIDKELGDTTVITISQRIKTLRESDLILVMDDGRIVDFGTHESLIKSSEIYLEVYETQKKVNKNG
ncbi:ABC transporter ATP-binding protein [Microaceticoccus formicicus]|uniref:ABC transporter ATP-binding protein n=1 Tax=Microaceticoccus formicicus TaxID=3118105 RepID=UPI003CD035C7|nr:ABC transporter ATP-binding protein [Peptoniphilaceae bacterium AMB_02]